ncbi:MAG: Gfo/Idh/MocA family oxidoreductase, partial [Lachnospiraceae bacterium]|nr:Gfo/Idh/MocA family oxidoreductase [Lachnospiraceae bacterium]
NQRLVKTHQKAKELLESGLIGKVLTFRTTFGHQGPETWSIDPGTATWFFDRSQSAMGALADLGVHKTDLIQYLLSAKVSRVTSKIATIDKKDANGNLIGVDDNAICIYEMDNGSIGTMTASWTYYGAEDNSTVLYGEKGIMRIFDDPNYSIKVTLRDGEEILFNVDQIQTNDNQTSTGIIDAFCDCIKRDTKPLIDAVDVLHAMKTVFAAIESSERGQAVEVSHV